MQNRLLAAVWASWVEFVAHEKENNRKLRAVVMKMQRRIEVMVLQEWHRVASESRRIKVTCFPARSHHLGTQAVPRELASPSEGATS
eukprot:1449732-Prymnesium_polylepis.1